MNQPETISTIEPPAATRLTVLSPERSEISCDSGIIYRSRVMHDLVSRALSFARSSATVLITGENGTGKELFARLIHDHSQRSQHRFAQVNCAALSESVIESELFGHERGAFTGADRNREGRFEWAHKGTLLLDEISEVSVGLQAKLLRVLEEGELQRVGSNEAIGTDVRVVATSNRELRQQVADGKFRQDLYYRLNVLRIHLPSLRSRPEDVPVLANMFLQRFKSESQHEIRSFSREALNILYHYSWPGNVRQLRNVIHCACVLAKSAMIEAHDLPELEAPRRECELPDWLLDMPLDEIERQVILQSLLRCDGNKTEVASVLGVTTRTLANKIKGWREQGLLRSG
jgi:DNA-binding NtrC family response regulator